MNPVVSGGYAWVVFTSRRAYGNFISRIPGASVSADGDVPFDNTQVAGTDQNTNAIKGYRKKLWVAAIDINQPGGIDISHPAFLLEGQETEAGNMRGFWALDPCKANDQSCETGDECCGGFCRQLNDADGGTHNACVVPPTASPRDDPPGLAARFPETAIVSPPLVIKDGAAADVPDVGSDGGGACVAWRIAIPRWQISIRSPRARR